MKSAGNGNILVQLSNLKFDGVLAISHVTGHSAMDGQLTFTKPWTPRVQGEVTGPQTACSEGGLTLVPAAHSRLGRSSSASAGGTQLVVERVQACWQMLAWSAAWG